MRFSIALVLGLAALASGAEFPEAEISNGTVTAKFYLPDAEKGYYRGTRFDWSGQIYSLKTNGHEYFGQWFPKYDPKLHDAIMGPVESFNTNDGGPGYAEAAVGGTFMRIGVGVVKKPEERGFQAFRTYDITDPGKWKIRKGKDWIEFTHDLKDSTGYGYRYTKKIRLVKGKSEMVIEHALKNTGKKPIESTQYNHNFFVMDGKPTGPDASVKFPFELTPSESRFNPELAEVRGKEIAYKKELVRGQSVYTHLSGFSGNASDYDIRIENKAAGAGVRIKGDVPLSKVVFWSIRTTLCPEPYIDVNVAPGKEKKWTYTYEFYNL